MKAEYIIAISKIKGIGDAFFKKNICNLRGLNDIAKLTSIDKRITQEAIDENMGYAQEVIKECNSLHIIYKTIFDIDYPEQLREISDPPAILYFKGNVSLLNKKIVSIIGSRKSSELGNKIAAKIGKYFMQNTVVCNGLVDGIDRWAISSMQKGTCNVIGVISGGLDFKYTSSSITKELANQVLENGGLLVSESEPRKKEDKFSGSKASRIQAGLSTVLILVQSSINGGSKYTIKPFVKLNRILGVIYFDGNHEFENNDSFSANRLVKERGIHGLMEFCSYSKLELIKLTKLVLIFSKADYDKIYNNLKYDENTLFS